MQYGLIEKLTSSCLNRLGRQRYLLYVAAQFLGGIVGAIALKLALPPALLATPFTTSGSMTEAHPIQVFLLEFICTFLLVLTVFATAVDKSGAAKVAYIHPHSFTCMT
jgi:glycerol uptake facilitator-like aquaporin